MTASGFRYQNVCLEAAVCTLPPHVVTSSDIERRLAPVYERLGLPEGRLEMFTGIRERRFFDPGTKPGTESAATVRKLLDHSTFDPARIGALLHGSVCRDQLEPATAAGVHAAAGLPQTALVFDVSNACLGILNGMQIVANLIETGQIQAAVVVGTETGRPLVERTIASLLAKPDLSRRDIKSAFASLTIGSGSAAVLLCRRELSRTGHRLLGGAWRADTTQHHLCEGDVANDSNEPGMLMQTDSEALMHAGVALASDLWPEFCRVLGWTVADIARVLTHQVGKAHRKLLLETLGIPADRDYPTVERFGNTGSAALPMALALCIEEGLLRSGDNAALLGIGSGLNALMLGLHWNGANAEERHP